METNHLPHICCKGFFKVRRNYKIDLPSQFTSSIGIRENLKLLAVYYPKWVMRLYYDIDMKDPLLKELCKIACEYDALDLCYVRCVQPGGGGVQGQGKGSIIFHWQM